MGTLSRERGAQGKLICLLHAVFLYQNSPANPIFICDECMGAQMLSNHRAKALADEGVNRGWRVREERWTSSKKQNQH